MSEVPADLAGKVLGAELRNVVKKIGEGGTLTTAEHERMQRATLEGVLPEDLMKAREAALLRRYALGQSLTKDQKSELSAVIPVGKPIAKRVTSESYRYKLSHYVPILGLEGKDPERKLKRWIAKGREKTPPDLPPFDSPHLMAEWWRRNMEWRVPFYLEKLEAQAGDVSESPAAEQRAVPASVPTPSTKVPATEPPKSAANGEQPGMPMTLDLGAEHSSDIGLVQIRALVVGVFGQLQRCLESGLLNQANNYRREWQSLVGTLRQWEKDIVKIQEGKGEVLRTRVINTELVRIFTVIRQSFTNEMLDLVEKLKPEMPPPERRDLVLRRRDKCFVHLKTTRFSTTYQPDE